MFNIVLIEPEIPQNTGNIIRTAAATGAKVHLVKPLGFDISDRALKRAGLDYWSMTDFTIYENVEDFFKTVLGESYAGTEKVSEQSETNFYFLSTKAQKRYDEIEFSSGDYLVFGKETKGIDEQLLFDNYLSTIRIPMVDGARSLNLSNAVAIVCYEGLRQQGFNNLQDFGHLTKF